jgi:aminoglycoside 3-N-acetyltransferase I
MEIFRLRVPDVALARRTILMMGEAFDEPDRPPLSHEYLTGLLNREEVWLYAALVEHQPVGGLTAHQLPMTNAEAAELLIYDIAVLADWRRRGIGRALVRQLLHDATATGIGEMWVPADTDDAEALKFYRRIGGVEQPVTIFTYPTSDQHTRARTGE